jgi:hypothetical protein
MALTQDHFAVGLIMGTRIHYSMWDAERDDDAAFETRLDKVVREIGERGKLMLPEAVPFQLTPAPTPALNRAPAPALAATGASVVGTPQTSALDFTPSMQSSPTPVAVHQEVARAVGSASASGGSFSEMVAFMREEREFLVSALEKQRAGMQALLDHERSGKERERQQNTKRAQIATLHRRVQALHATQLLTDEELYRFEDIIADDCEVDDGDGGDGGDGRVAQMLALSDRMVVEAAFVRQLRRKFV